MWLHSSMTDDELIRSTMLAESPYLRLLAHRLETRIDQLNRIQKIAESVVNSTDYDRLLVAGFDPVAQKFCDIELLTDTETI